MAEDQMIQEHRNPWRGFVELLTCASALRCVRQVQAGQGRRFTFDLSLVAYCGAACT